MNYLQKLSKQVLLQDFIVILAVTSFVLLIKLGMRPLAVWDEGLYCGTTQDMQVHSQWLFPTINGEFSVRYGKPPLVNWLQGLSSAVMGWSKFSLRFPTALGMVAQVMLVWITGRLIAGRWVGLVSACLLLVSRNLIGMGRTIWLENLVAPLFAASLLCYGKTFFASRRFPLSGTVLSGIFSGLAILTKQSFGLFAPAALIVVELIRRKPGMTRRILVYNLALFISCAWWFFLTAYFVGNTSWESWFGYHIYERLTETVEGHSRNPDSFALSLQWIMDGTPWVVGLLGWAFLLKNTPKDTEASDLVERWTALLIIEYIVVGLVSKTFLPWYQLVVTLPLSVGCAYILVESFRHRQYPFWIRWMIPLLIITNRLIEVKRDAFLVACVGILLIWLYETYQWQRFWKPACASLLIVLAGLFALRAADSYRRPDIRAVLTQDLQNQASVVVIANSPLWRIWKCYLPKASTFPVGWPCDEVQQTIKDVNANHIVVDSPKPLTCPLTGFHSVEQVKEITLWEKDTPL